MGSTKNLLEDDPLGDPAWFDQPVRLIAAALADAGPSLAGESDTDRVRRLLAFKHASPLDPRTLSLITRAGLLAEKLQRLIGELCRLDAGSSDAAELRSRLEKLCAPDLTDEESRLDALLDWCVGVVKQARVVDVIKILAKQEPAVAALMREHPDLLDPLAWVRALVAQTFPLDALQVDRTALRELYDRWTNQRGRPKGKRARVVTRAKGTDQLRANLVVAALAPMGFKPSAAGAAHGAIKRRAARRRVIRGNDDLRMQTWEALERILRWRNIIVPASRCEAIYASLP
jgi:hypothetical protein